MPSSAEMDDRRSRILPALGAHLAGLHGLPNVINLGTNDWAEVAVTHPWLRRTDLVVGPDVISRTRGISRTVRWGKQRTRLPLSDDERRGSALVALLRIDDRAGKGPPTSASASAAARLVGEVPLALIAAERDADLDVVLASGDAATCVTLTGRLAGADLPAATLAIIDRIVGQPSCAPDGFRVLAIVTAYNEADIIASTIEALARDGIEVHVIDNWSTDGTYEIAERYRERGLVGLERYPIDPSPRFDLEHLLLRVEEVAAASTADWVIHHDADERRRGPWGGIGLRDALWTVQRSGFNAVDHTVLNFRPVDDGFSPSSDPEAYFRHFEFGKTPDSFLQIKAWRNTRERVQLADSGGHQAVFAGRRVFPYKFLLKHYPIRSQAHGERKILVERQARWNPAERAKGWHLHYDEMTPTTRFVRDPNELLEFVDGLTQRDYLVPLVSGVGLGPEIPDWALRGRTGAAVYRSVRALDESMVGRSFRRSVVPKLPIPRRLARRMQRAIFGGPA
jgi:glycosyltransferase involved in cell wall biosynthesis